MRGCKDAITAIVKDYCEKYPTTLNRTLARVILSENPSIQMSLDLMRDRVRNRRGTHGMHRRTVAELIPRQNIPDEVIEPDSYSVRDFSSLRGNGIIISDLHIPFHDPNSISMTLEFAAKHDLADFIIIDGDFFDMYEFSFFCRNPKINDFEKSRESGWRILDLIREMFGDKCRILFKMSNHDYRWVRYMCTHAPELATLKEFALEKVLKLQDWGCEVIGYNEKIVINNLNIIHGHEFGGGASSPVNPARTAWLKTSECTLVAHSHRTSEHSETTISDKLITCWSIGCLCNLHPNYRPVGNRWNTGFATLYVDSTGFLVKNHRIYKNNVY